MTKPAASKPPREVVETMKLHMAGRLDEAERRYRALLPEHPRVADLHYGIGFLALQKRQSDAAMKHLETARMLRPGHAKTLGALGSAYLGTGRVKEAMARFGEAFQAEPSAMAAENWAIAARQAGDFKTMVQIYETASQSGFATPRLQSMAAHATAGLGDADRAAEIVRQAVEGAPNDIEIRQVAGKIATLRMQPKEAITHLELAVEQAPSAAQLHLDLAWAYIFGERADDAARALRAAVQYAGGNALILRDCAKGLERLNLLAEAEPIAAEAAKALPGDAILSTLRSTLARRDGRLEDAHDVLAPLIHEAPVQHRDVWFEWAKVLDGLGDVEAAGNAYGKANELWRAYPNSVAWAEKENRDMEARLRDVESLPEIALPEGLAPLPFRVVFVTGFPRSGTTLVDRILGAHSTVSILEEKPLIEAVLKQVEDKHGPYPACLPALAANRDDMNALRDFFAKTVELHGGAPGGVLLDKHPINYWRLGLIRLLFPEAPILVLRRNPLDSVLSCWQQDFFHAPNLCVFSTLPDAAAAFDQWHRLVEAIGRRLPLDLIDLKYEELAAEPEKTIRQVLPRLGLDWEDAIMRFAEHTVAGAVVTSASYAQVGEQINSKAVGKWKRYEKQLSAVVGVLKPWCDRFGYSV
ncbi:sulfotransferase family protein [Hwanghaeella grinnelliae]|nr:sulfotransferase [Hwanghaeella grinnelliae]